MICFTAMDLTSIIYNIAVSLPGFLLGIVCHEAAHAYMADRFGDPTARHMGRLSLNPAVHYDLFGTIIFPLIGLCWGGFMDGWVIAAFLYAVLNTKVNTDFSYFPIFSSMLTHAIQINVILAAFNLIPIPPLDGSKMVSSMLDYNAARKFEELQRYSFVIFLVFILTPILSYILTPALYMANFITNVFLYILR